MSETKKTQVTGVEQDALSDVITHIAKRTAAAARDAVDQLSALDPEKRMDADHKILLSYMACMTAGLLFRAGLGDSIDEEKTTKLIAAVAMKMTEAVAMIATLSALDDVASGSDLHGRRPTEAEARLTKLVSAALSGVGEGRK